MDIITDIDKLRQNCETVPINEIPNYNNIIEEMYQICMRSNGVGLAAPQIGINKRFFVMYWNGITFAVFNPIIFDSSILDAVNVDSELIKFNEGCLSVPGQIRTTTRLKRITVTYYNLHQDQVFDEFDLPLSVIFQHETDHLNGKLIIDF